MADLLPTIPEAISDLQKLTLYARRAVEGTFSGLHRSRLFGSSIQFAEHKPYSPGDDLRFIDWKVFGRADKFYLKRYEDETNLRAYVVVDHSRSMDFGTVGHTKSQFASVLGAVLSYLFLWQHDLVALLRYGKGDPVYIPPRARMPHFQILAEALTDPHPAGEENLSSALAYLRDRIHRRAIVAVVSDFLEPVESLERMARIFRAAEQEMVWFQVLDRAEIEFPFSDWARFRGLEGEGEIEANALAARRGYQREITAWLKHLKDTALEHGIRYRQVNTSESIPSVLASVVS